MDLMLERRGSGSIQVGEGVVGGCALIDGVVLGGAGKLSEAIGASAWPSLSMTVADRGLAWGFYVTTFGVGLLIAVLPSYSTVKGWYQRAWWANTLRVGSAILCAIIGLWVALIAVETSGVIY
jgi:hypothetical protein